jgi:hypothetical protein
MFYCCIGLQEIQHGLDSSYSHLLWPAFRFPSRLLFRFPHQNLSLTEFGDHRPFRPPRALKRCQALGPLGGLCLDRKGAHCKFGEGAPNHFWSSSQISSTSFLAASHASLNCYHYNTQYQHSNLHKVFGAIEPMSLCQGIPSKCSYPLLQVV